MARGINTKDIDILLDLFRQLEKLLNPKLPEKNKELWERCLKQAEKEFINELKDHEKLLSARTSPRKATKEEEKEFRKVLQHNITKMAERKYRQTDSKYDRSCLQIKEEIAKVLKEIDHFIYSIKGPLLKFDRAHGTLLVTDWQKIRDFLSIIDITQDNFRFYVQEAIDALEAIKAKIERQEQTELETTPLETEQKAALGRRIWIGIKKIPHWIYYILGAFAALLTILHYLGWIEPIKNLFTGY